MVQKPAEWAKRARDEHTGGPAEKAVLLILAVELDLEGICRLSAKEIARRADTDPSTAERILERLRDRGLISWKTGAGRAPNTYVLHLVENRRSTRSHRELATRSTR